MKMRSVVWLWVVVCLTSGVSAETLDDNASSSIVEQSRLLENQLDLFKPLHESGITTESSLIIDYSKNLRGGADTSGDATRHLFDFNMTFDLDQILGIERATFFVDFQTQNGQDGSEEVGDIQAFSNIDEADFTALYEVWYEQWFGDILRLKIGKVDANSEFAFVEHGGEFINSSPGFSPTIFALPTYPDPAMSINVFVYPSSDSYVGLAVYDGAAQEGVKVGRRGPSTFYEDPADLFYIGEAGKSWSGGDSNLNGRLGVGVWHHDGSFTRFDGTTDHGTFGYYVVVDQQLYRENPDDPGDSQGIGGFLQLGIADGDVSEIKHHYSLGAAWTGAMDGRDDDITGLMLSYVELSDTTGSGFTEDFELAIELFHRLQITPWFAIKPDLQWIINPGGDKTLSDALVATLRTELIF